MTAPVQPVESPSSWSDTPLLSLRGVWRLFGEPGQAITVLQDINLDIRPGEMVAIMGPSGSGKSTLMNLLGCLDQPSRGSYRVRGRDTRALNANARAALRREHFGFVFQRYQLLADLDAQANVEMPALYAGATPRQRRARAQALLQRLGLGDRLHHKPAQLSGGQQQRVSIARALMNGGQVILADEPTGALDSLSGAQVMALLKELHAAGHTVIVVTHDRQVAAHAQRIIEIADGRIERDSASQPSGAAAPVSPEETSGLARADGPPTRHPRAPGCFRASGWSRWQASVSMALGALSTHQLRTALTLLGIVIGIVSVGLVNALGEGSRQRILSDMNSLGTHTIELFPGAGAGDRRAESTRTLVVADAQAVRALPGVDSVTPQVQHSLTLQRGALEKNATAVGASADYFRVRGLQLALGREFDEQAVRHMSADVVIDAATRKIFFRAHENPIGQTLLAGQVPLRVVGVTARNDLWSSGGLTLWLPYSSVMARMTGTTHLQQITVRVRSDHAARNVERDIVDLLTQRHGSRDFYLHNSDTLRATVEKTTRVLQGLILSIAVIALLVGGIGVMNIMLVSVTERTSEIGLRMAVGARSSDILRQFLIEAVLVCVLGGVVGLALAWLLGMVIQPLLPMIQLVFSPVALAIAMVCASLIGVVFGYWPARNAARLNPVEALART